MKYRYLGKTGKAISEIFRYYASRKDCHPVKIAS